MFPLELRNNNKKFWSDRWVGSYDHEITFDGSVIQFSNPYDAMILELASLVKEYVIIFIEIKGK